MASQDGSQQNRKKRTSFSVKLPHVSFIGGTSPISIYNVLRGRTYSSKSHNESSASISAISNSSNNSRNGSVNANVGAGGPITASGQEPCKDITSEKNTVDNKEIGKVSTGYETVNGNKFEKTKLSLIEEKDVTVRSSNSNSSKVNFAQMKTRIAEKVAEKAKQFEENVKSGTAFNFFKGDQKNQNQSFVVVKVVEGRNLLAGDINGKSDPYVTLNLNGTKKKTQVVRKTLCPVWNQTFVFQGNFAEDDSITMFVKDWDLVGYDDLLGVLEIPLWGIVETANVPKHEFKLDKTMATYLSSHYIDSDSDDDDSQTSSVLSLEKRTTNTPDHKNLKQHMIKMGQVLKEVISSDALNHFGVSLRRTGKGQHNVNAECFRVEPRWYALRKTPGMRSIRGEIKLGFEYYPGVKTVQSNPKERNSDFDDNGSVESSISGSEPYPIASHHTLASRMNSIQQGYFCRRRPRVKVHVLKARSIKVSDPSGHSDPYVMLACRKTKHRTKSCRKTLEPEWNETFEFGGVRDYLLDTDSIVIRVFDKDILSFNDELGTVSIPLWSIKGDSDAHWYKLLPPTQEKNPRRKMKEKHLHFLHAIHSPQVLLQDSDTVSNLGEILIKVEYITTKGIIEDPNSNKEEAPVVLADEYKGKVWFYELRARVVSGRNLRDPSNAGRINAYAVISCGASEDEKTDIVRNSVNPVWYECFTFRDSAVPGAMGLSQQDTLTVTIKNARRDNRRIPEKDVTCGTCVIDISSLIKIMGYIDKDGKTLVKTFDLIPPEPVPSDENEMDGSVSISSRKRSQCVRLSLRLVPVAETRMANYQKVVIRVEKVKGLKYENEQQVAESVYLTAKLGIQMFETSACTLNSGFITFNQQLLSSELETLDLQDYSLDLFLHSVQDEMVLATVSVPLRDVNDAKKTTLKGWLPLKFANESNMSKTENLYAGNCRMSRFRSKPMLRNRKPEQECNRAELNNSAADSPQIELSLRLVSLQQPLQPTLGYIRIKLLKFKLYSHGFDHNLRWFIIYGKHTVYTRAFDGTVGADFDDDEAFFRFPVKDMYTTLVIQLRDMFSNGKKIYSRSIEAGKFRGETKLTVFDLVEREAQLVFSSKAVLQPAVQTPLKLYLTGAKSEIRGNILVLAEFEEDMSGTLSTNANPVLKKPKKVTPNLLFKEMDRFFKAVTWIFTPMKLYASIMAWEHVTASAFALITITFFCLIDFWTERVLVLIPLIILTHILRAHALRNFGIQDKKNRITDNDTKAKLRISVLKGESLIARDSNGKSDPYVRISMVENNKNASVIGRTRTVYRSLSPDWSDCIRGFSARSNSTLLTWQPSYTSAKAPTFETFVPRTVLQSRELVVRVFCLRGISDHSHTRRKCKTAIVKPSIAHIDQLFNNSKSGFLHNHPKIKSQDIDKDKDKIQPKPLIAGKLYENFSKASVLIERDDIKIELSELSKTGNTGTNIQEARVTGVTTWNEQFVFGRGSSLDDETVIVIAIEDMDENKRSSTANVIPGTTFGPLSELGSAFTSSNHSNETRRYAFIPLVYLLSYLERSYKNSLKQWFTLEECNRMGEWETSGEILVEIINYSGLQSDDMIVDSSQYRDDNEDELSLQLQGYREKDKDLLLAGKAEAYLDEDSWAKACTQFWFDVFDEDKLGGDEFLGRAEMRWSSLLTDLSKREQGVFEQWIPLGVRYYSSKEDRDLWSLANARIKSNMLQDKSHRTRGRRSTLLNRLGFRRNRSLGTATADDDVNNDVSMVSTTEQIEERMKILRRVDSISPEYGYGHSDGDGDLFDYPKEPFGKILVRAQIILPEPDAAAKLKAAEDLKRAEYVGFLELGKLYSVYQKRIQMFHDNLFLFNNQIESVKNLFNWTHPRKTKFVMNVVLFLVCLFLIFPSRIIVLAVSLFLLTEHFRPLGVVMIKLRHLQALVPTDEDIKDVYASGSVMGENAKKKFKGSNHESDQGSNSHEESDLQLVVDDDLDKRGHQRQHFNMFAHVKDFVGKHNNAKFRHSQEISKFYNEENFKMGGHLRMLVIRNKNPKTIKTKILHSTQILSWKRCYFGLFGNQLCYWAHKADCVTRHPDGVFSGICGAFALGLDHNNTHYKTLLEHGLNDVNAGYTFVLNDTYDRTRLTSSDKENVTQIVYLVASSKKKRDIWLKHVKKYLLCEKLIGQLGVGVGSLEHSENI